MFSKKKGNRKTRKTRGAFVSETVDQEEPETSRKPDNTNESAGDEEAKLSDVLSSRKRKRGVHTGSATIQGLRYSTINDGMDNSRFQGGGGKYKSLKKGFTHEATDSIVKKKMEDFIMKELKNDNPSELVPSETKLDDSKESDAGNVDIIENAIDPSVASVKPQMRGLDIVNLPTKYTSQNMMATEQVLKNQKLNEKEISSDDAMLRRFKRQFFY